MQENITFKMNLVSRLAAADCTSAVAGNIEISKHTCTIIYHQQDPITWMYWKSSSKKTARYFSKILHHIVEHNISFQMNLVSRLAAAVCAPGNHLNFNIANHSDTVISHNSYKLWLQFKTPCTKTARYLRLIFHQRMLENITFKMNLVSRLAAADCTSGVAGNIEMKYFWKMRETLKLVSILVRSYITNKTQITWMYWKSSSPKTARYFSKILHHIVEHNISFQMNLVSRLAAAVCAPGNHLNINIANHADTVISHNNYKIWL